VDFGILADKENCCGESIRKIGSENVFIDLAKTNIKTFIDAGVKKILVSSPHCYHTFKNEYPEFMVNFEVIHMSEYLLDLIDTGRLTLSGEMNEIVTYHDPCYLGRHNNIYDAPRLLLEKVNGLTLLEMADHGKNSLCCGGGGGRIWMDTPQAERFSDIRLKQATDVGAKVLVTSCPYCITNFEESRLNLEYEEVLEIRDITEIINDML
jgi:Fe-S oxidoreductase